MRRFWVSVVLMSIGAFLLAAIVRPMPTGNTPRLPTYPRLIARIGSKDFTLLETRTDEEKRLGLSSVPTLPPRYGMLFHGKGQMTIWMKGMSYPIDILWLDKDNRVIYVVHDAQPSSYPKTIFSNPLFSDARTVIEINAGEAKRLGITNRTIIPLN